MLRKDNKNNNLQIKILYLQMNNISECIDSSKKLKKKLQNN